MHLKKTLTSALVAAGIGCSGAAVAADIVIGVPNWPSVAATADILKVVIEDNYGLEVELQNATNPVVFEAMDSGSMHVHPEVWLPNQQNLHDLYVEQKRSVSMNPHGVPSFTGICVTRDTQQRTGITAVAELTDPDMIANFDEDGNGKGDMWIGAPGWASTSIEKIRARSYGFDATMDLLELDETLALSKVDAAVARAENIVFMCYTPHHMFTLYDLVVLDEPAHDPEKWQIVQPTDNPDWLEKSSAPVAWGNIMLHVMFASSLKDSHPEVASLLSNIKLDIEQVSGMTYAVVVDKVDTAEFARQWVAENAELVNSWL